MPPGADAVAQARQLLQQLRSLASQHGEVLSAYERQLEAMVAAGPSKLTKAPNKRPLLSEPEGPEAKKQRIVQEQQQRRNSLWHECYKVLDRCRRNQRAEAFKKPVDPVRMKIPDYPLVVKNPMDLQTVGEKLKVRVYKDPSEFAADMRLIWDNAQLYNGRNHPVGINAMAMSEFFEKAWAPLQIEKQWAIQLQQEELAQQALQGNLDSMPSSDLPRQLKEKREMVGHYIAAKDYNDGMPPGALGPCEPGRAMTFEEKRRLSAFLTNIPLAATEPGEKLQRVVEIVEEGLPPGDGGEVEVDIDALPDAVLWRLKEHIDSVLAPPTGTTPAKGGAATKGGGTPGGPATKAPPAPAPAAAATAQPPTVQAAAAPAAVGTTPPAGTPPPPMPTASQLAMPAPPALGAPPQQAAPQQQQQQQQAPGSPPLSGADSAHDVQDSNAPGRPLTSAAPYIPGDGTVAQSGIHRPSSTFVKAGKAEVDTSGLNAAAWGAAPTTAPNTAAPAADAAPGTNGAPPAGTPPPAAGTTPPPATAAAAPATEGTAAAAAPAPAAPAQEDDDLWDEFAGKAAKQERELEQQKAEEQRRKQQEEEQRRALEEAERAREAERAAAVEAEKARARDELMGAAGRAQLGEDGALASEVQRLAAAGGGDDAAAGLGLAQRGEEEEEDEDMGLDG